MWYAILFGETFPKLSTLTEDVYRLESIIRLQRQKSCNCLTKAYILYASVLDWQDLKQISRGAMHMSNVLCMRLGL